MMILTLYCDLLDKETDLNLELDNAVELVSLQIYSAIQPLAYLPSSYKPQIDFFSTSIELLNNQKLHKRKKLQDPSWHQMIKKHVLTQDETQHNSKLKILS